MIRLGLIISVIAIFGTLLSVFVADRAYEQEVIVDRIALSRAIDVHASLVQERMAERELLARVSSGLFRSPSLLVPNMLQPLRASIYAFKTDFVTASWIARIAPDEIGSLSALLRDTGFGQTAIRGYGGQPRDLNNMSSPIDVLIDVEPKTADSTALIGRTYDDSPIIGSALNRAGIEGNPIASDPTALMRRAGALGVILVAPVVAGDGNTAGFITFSYEISGLMLTNDDLSLFQISVADPRQSGSELFVSESGRVEPREALAKNAVVRIVNFGSHDWELRYYSKSDIEARAFRLAVVIALIGIAITSVVCGLFGYVAFNTVRLSREIEARISYERRLTTVIDELNHRVKNILAVIQSIVTRTLRHGTDIDAGRELLIGRIHAMSNVVSLLSESQWQGVPIRGLFAARSIPHADRIAMSGPDIMVSARAAQSLSLLFYELASHVDEGLSLVGKHPNVVAKWDVQGEPDAQTFHFRWEEFNTSEQTRRPETDFSTALLDRVAPEALGGTAKRHFSDVSYIYELTAPLDTVVDLTERQRTDQIVAPVETKRRSLLRH